MKFVMTLHTCQITANLSYGIIVVKYDKSLNLEDDFDGPYTLVLLSTLNYKHRI